MELRLGWGTGLKKPLSAAGQSVQAHPRTAIAAVLGLAVALRAINLDAKVLWYDEAFAVLYAEKNLSAILHGTYASVQGAASDVHPVGYYALLHFWLALGQAPWLVRLPSLLFGAGTVWLGYLLMRHLFDRNSALLAAALLAISPFQIWYSQEARMYSMLGFVQLLAAYALVRALRRGGPRWWAGFAAASAASAYLHNLAMFTLLPLIAYAGWAAGRSQRRRWVGASSTLAILLVPWAILLWGQLAKVGQAYWVGRPGVADVVRTITTFHFHQPALNLPAPADWLPWLLFSSLALLALTMRGAVPLMARPGPDRDGVLLLLTVSVGPPALMFLVSLVRPVYLERALLGSGIAYILLLAVALSRGAVPGPIKAATLLILPLLGISLAFQYSYSGFPRSSFPEAVAYLRQSREDGDLVIHDNKLSFFPSHYYDRRLPQSYLADPAGAGSDTLALPTQEVLGLYATPAVSDAALAGRTIWFVIFSQAVEEAANRGVPNPHLAWLDTHRVLAAAERFGDLLIYRYVAPATSG